MADDEWKHGVDALRYALDSYIFGQIKRGPVVPIRVR